MQPAVPEENRVARGVTWTIVGVNVLLLLISLPDYRVSIDSGYHISLARWYAAHGAAWWDHINFGPGGRPNLQGPAFHIAIAIVGRFLGGSADSFILANAILAIDAMGGGDPDRVVFRAPARRRFGRDVRGRVACGQRRAWRFHSTLGSPPAGCSSRFHGQSTFSSKIGW